jgi:hypothetical protein
MKNQCQIWKAGAELDRHNKISSGIKGISKEKKEILKKRKIQKPPPKDHRRYKKVGLCPKV